MIAKKSSILGMYLTWFYVVLIFISFVLPTSVFSQSTICGEDDEDYEGYFESPLLNKSGDLNAKVIFINFPEDSIPINTISSAKKANLDALCSFFTEISLPTKTMTWDLIEMPDDSTETIPWSAGLASIDYREPDTELALFARSRHWWSEPYETTGYMAAALVGEILFNIKDAYEGADEDNPFDNTDILIVNFLFSDSENGYASPIYRPASQWVGGYGKILLKPHSEYEYVVDPYFSGLQAWDDEYILGTLNVSRINDLSSQTILTHEFGHTLNLEHPTDFNSDDWQERYNYGLLNVMTPGYAEGMGCQTYSLSDISQLGFSEMPNWYQVVDFTGKNLYNETVYDIRSNDAVTYKYSLDDVNGNPQYFLFAYHGVNPIDVPQDPETPPGVLQGLEVQHCFGGYGATRDLESAFGRFDDTSGEEFVETGYWTDQNTSDGFDNHDSWQDRDSELYEYYQGHENDFFSFTGNKIFGYIPDCNPNTFGIDPNSPLTWRRRPNNQPSSLYVRIKSQADDHMVVDFLSAPYEKLVIASEMNIEEETTISWEYPYFDNQVTQFEAILDTVDLYYSRNGGNNYSEIELGIPLGTHQASWTPKSWDVSSNGVIKAVFHNLYTSQVGEFEIETPDITGFSIPTEYVLKPSGGGTFSVDDYVSVEWTYEHEMKDFYTYADVYLLDNNGGNPIEVKLNTEDVLIENGKFIWEVTGDHAADSARIKVVFHSLQGCLEGTHWSLSDGNFSVLPASETVLTEIPPDQWNNLDGLNYTGVPVTYASFDYDLDGAQDLLMAREGLSGLLYQGALTNDDSDAPDFVDRTGTVFPETMKPVADARAFSISDYNKDEYPDFFCAADVGAALYSWNSGISKFEIVSFAGDWNTKIQSSWAGAWGDFDGNGWDDLFVSGASQGAGLPSSYLFENIGESGVIGFTDVTGDIMGFVPSDYRTAYWVDVDGENGLDLFVLTSYGGCELFLQNRTNSLVKVAGNILPAEYYSSGGLDATLYDVDLDGDIDILIALDDQPPVLMYNKFNEGGTFSNATVIGQEDLEFGVSSISARDIDGNGLIDIIAVPIDEFGHLRSPEVFVNLSPSFNSWDLNYVRSLGYFGLNDIGKTNSFFSSDMDSDGDWDLYLGREINTEKIYYHSRYEPINGSGSDEPNGNWVGLKFPNWIAGLGGTPGATVTIREPSEGPILGTKVLGAMDGRAGRDEMRCLFGLGNHSGDVDVFVALATGTVLELTVSSGGYHQISSSDFVEDSVLGAYVADPLASTVEWVFSWDTKYSSTNEEDEVRIIEGTYTGGCLPGGIMVLNAETPGVSVSSVTANPDGTWHHEISWEGQCSPCGFNWEVSSWIEGSSVVGEIGTYKVKSCLGM